MRKNSKLVKYDTALLAKEKGFDVQTYSDCWVETLDGEIIHNSDRKNIPEHDRCRTHLLQPSLELLSRWLRIKHDINIALTKGKVLNWMVLVESNNVEKFEMDGDYELVFEKAINYALKLIQKK